MPEQHKSKVIQLPDGNYQHTYGVIHKLPVNWWYTTDYVFFADAETYARLSQLRSEVDEPRFLVRVITEPDPSRKVKLDETVLREWKNAFLSGTTKDVSPRSLFIDMTYLGYGERGQARGEIIEAHCSDRNSLAFIDYHPEFGWVFHSLYEGNDPFIQKKKIARLIVALKKQANKGMEVRLEQALADKLRSEGHAVRQQVACASGIADIVTEEAIYEIKSTLTRQRIFEAVGQVLLYRQEINPSLRPVIAGRESQENTDRLLEVVARMGIRIEVLK